MREILFRGKRVDNGKWVYGSYIRFRADENAFDAHQIYSYYNNELYDVISKTVGQYTGLKDKNGKKIFEGDICGCFCKTQIFEVKYCDDRCGYFFDECVTSGGCKPAPECLGNLRNTIEVIGNIHDNPELLEVMR